MHARATYLMVFLARLFPVVEVIESYRDWPDGQRLLRCILGLWYVKFAMYALGVTMTPSWGRGFIEADSRMDMV